MFTLGSYQSQKSNLYEKILYFWCIIASVFPLSIRMYDTCEFLNFVKKILGSIIILFRC